MKIDSRLLKLGFNQKLQQYLLEHNETTACKCYAGRIAVVHKGLYKIYTAKGEILSTVSGRMQYTLKQTEDLPAVGDWVILNTIDARHGNAVIKEVLPRKSRFSRKIAGPQPHEQIIAANIDFLFICISLNKDFNVRRMERYLTMAWESGACPVIVLTKADLCADLPAKLSQVQAVALGVNTLVISVVAEKGIEALSEYLDVGITGAFIGSSGVGKSTLINYLAGAEILSTNTIRQGDDKGKHTTTHRELILLNKGLVIDNPGMRELHILDADQGMLNTFSDIAELARQCKFKNCRHLTEPHCAVKKAIEAGHLSQQRLNNYFKLQKEAAYIARKNRIKEMKANRKS